MPSSEGGVGDGAFCPCVRDVTTHGIDVEHEECALESVAQVLQRVTTVVNLRYS